MTVKGRQTGAINFQLFNWKPSTLSHTKRRKRKRQTPLIPIQLKHFLFTDFLFSYFQTIFRFISNNRCKMVWCQNKNEVRWHSKFKINAKILTLDTFINRFWKSTLHFEANFRFSQLKCEVLLYQTLSVEYFLIKPQQ